MTAKSRRPSSDLTYVYALYCTVTGEVRYVGRSDRPCERYKAHTSWVRRCKRHARIKRVFPNHRISLPDPRTSAEGAWLWSLDRRLLSPRLAVLQQVLADEWREAGRRWTERLIQAGRRLTVGERRSLDTREREERLLREAIVAGRKAVAWL